MITWASTRVNNNSGDELLAQIFFDPAGFQDPLPLYRQYQEEVGTSISGIGMAVLSRYDDCRQILRDSRFGNGDNQPGGPFGGADPEVLAYRKEMAERRRGRPLSMLALDPPDHTRQRSLVSRAFTPRTVEKLRPRIRQLVDELLGTISADHAGQAVDLMEVLAKPLPVTVISEMLGVPGQDWSEIRDAVTEVVAALEPSATIAELKRSEAANGQLLSYFTDLLGRRRAEPADDLLSGLLAASDGTDTLSEGEILAVALLLFAAGAETTTNLIGNGMNLLLNHPEQLSTLWANPELVPSAVEEMLRHDSPVQLDGRTCLEAATTVGLSFEPGDRVVTLLGAANHDPDHFQDPDSFLIDRFASPGLLSPDLISPDIPKVPAPSPIMSFASGIHYCLGANLARVEGEEAFRGLIRHFDSIESAGARVFRARLTLRGLHSCPVVVHPRA